MSDIKTQVAEQVTPEKITIRHRLPKQEVAFYFAISVGGLLYMYYNVYLDGKRNVNAKHLKDGWKFLGLKRDGGDYYFEEVVAMFPYMVFFGMLHFLGAEVVKCCYIKGLPYYYTTFSLVLVTVYIDAIFTSLFLLQTLINFAFAFYASKIIIWTYGLTSIIALHSAYAYPYRRQLLERHQTLFIWNIFIFNALRCLAFGLYVKKSLKTSSTYARFVDFVGYSFYLPTLYLGLFLLYEDFECVYTAQPKEIFKKRLMGFGGSAFKHGVRLCVALFLGHFLRAGKIFTEYETYSYATLLGFFYWLGVMHMLKWQILFGLSGSASKAEEISSPSQPRCVVAMTVYSEIWRTFDQGLYNFGKRYIFEEVSGHNSSPLKKNFASLLCFVFMDVWHGSGRNIHVWVAINYIQVTLEAVVKATGKTGRFLKFYRKYLSPPGLRRMVCLLIAPMYIISCAGQFAQFTSHHVAYYHLETFLNGGYLNHGCTLFFAYCLSQIYVEITMREQTTYKFH